MTLPRDAYSIGREIDHARAKLQKRIERITRIVQGMGGDMVLATRDGAAKLVENFYHEYVSYVLPRLVSQDPRVRVDTPLAGRGAQVAAGCAAGINQWIIETRHRIFAQRMATDYLLGYGAATLVLQRRAGFTDDDEDLQIIPAAVQLDPGSVWFDIGAMSSETRRFTGYSYAIDKDDLVERAKSEPGWNLGLVKDLPVDAGLDEVKRDKEQPRRHECVIRECWVPDANLINAPEYSHGAIVTLAKVGTQRDGMRDIFVRAPRPFFGPPWGPIYIYDAYYVPGQPLGMSPCEAVAELVDELNAHVRQLSRDTASRKRIGIGPARSQKDVETLRSTQHGNWALLEKLDDPKVFAEIELGGGTAEQRNAVMEIRLRLQELGGLSDTLKGAVTGVGSPTEVAEATQAGALRISYLSQRFADCDEHLLRGLLYYLMRTRSFVMRVASQDMGAPDGMEVTMDVRGGPDPGIEPEDMMLSIERYTMERTSEAQQQRQAMNLVQQTIALCSQAPMIAPFADVRKLLDVIGDANNRPNWGSVIHPQGAVDAGERMRADDQEDPEQPDVSGPRPVRSIAMGQAS